MFKMIQKSVTSENILLLPKKYREESSNVAFLTACLALLLTLKTKPVLLCCIELQLLPCFFCISV